MANWFIRLRGNNFDLQDLPSKYKSTETKIFFCENFYYLESALFELLTTNDDVFLNGKELIEKINEIEKFQNPNYHYIELDHIFFKKDDGTHDIFVKLENAVTTRAKPCAVIVTNTSQANYNIGDSSTISERLFLLMSNKTIKDVFHFYAENDWINFYKVFEIIREDFGGGKSNMINSGLASQNELDDFTATAQSRSVLGDEARHAAPKYDKVLNPMSFLKAKDFINRLIKNWLSIKYNFY